MNRRYGQVLGCGEGSDLPAPALTPAVEPTHNSLRAFPVNRVNMAHVRYFRLSHIQDYVTYAAHRRQHFFDL
jgi:hypothetical protein